MAKKKTQGNSENQESIHDEIRWVTLNLMVLRSRLHKRLMNIILCLESLDIVGIAADDKPSVEFTLEQHRLFSQGIDEAISCIVCELPQTDFTQELYTVLYMIKQNLLNARKLADNAINAGNEKNVIHHIQEAFTKSKEETLIQLKRLGAQLQTKESIRELRELSNTYENVYNLLEIENDLAEYEKQTAKNSVEGKHKKPLAKTIRKVLELKSELKNNPQETLKQVNEILKSQGYANTTMDVFKNSPGWKNKYKKQAK